MLAFETSVSKYLQTGSSRWYNCLAMLKHSSTENSALFPKQEKAAIPQDSLKAVGNGLAFVMIGYSQSHTTEMVIESLVPNCFGPTAFEECILHCFHIWKVTSIMAGPKN